MLKIRGGFYICLIFVYNCQQNVIYYTKVIKMRLDKFLKVSKIIRRRTIANQMADKGKISVNGKKAKPSYEIKIDDIIEIQFGSNITKLQVIKIPLNNIEVTEEIVKRI